jgi:hypothetical protein
MCTPIQNYWIVGAPEDTCMDEGIATLVCGVISCVADLATTLTPLPLILGVSHTPPSLVTPILTDASSKCHFASVSGQLSCSVLGSSSRSPGLSELGVSVGVQCAHETEADFSL